MAAIKCNMSSYHPRSSFYTAHTALLFPQVAMYHLLWALSDIYKDWYIRAKKRYTGDTDNHDIPLGDTPPTYRFQDLWLAMRMHFFHISISVTFVLCKVCFHMCTLSCPKHQARTLSKCVISHMQHALGDCSHMLEIIWFRWGWHLQSKKEEDDSSLIMTVKF